MLGHNQTHCSTHSYGTATHAAPELLSNNKLTKAADVYSFAMISKWGKSGLFWRWPVAATRQLTVPARKQHAQALPCCVCLLFALRAQNASRQTAIICSISTPTFALPLHSHYPCEACHLLSLHATYSAAAPPAAVYEVAAGEEPYQDMSALQVILQVTHHGYRPALPEGFPPALGSLMQRCWDTDPQLRCGCCGCKLTAGMSRFAGTN